MAKALDSILLSPRQALFLDRDGVVNVDRGYVHTPEECEFMPGIFELVRAAKEKGYLIFIITNQAGIGRGYYSEADFLEFSSWIEDRFAEKGAKIEKTYHCPHHPEAGLGDYLKTCECRKPKPGMILQAARDYDINLSMSLMLGDKESDRGAAVAAGVGRFMMIHKEEDIKKAISAL